MNNQEIAIDLTTFIKYYIPTGWKESISKVAFVPYVTASDIPNLRLGIFRLGLDHWYFQEAIQKYFDSKKSNKVQDSANSASSKSKSIAGAGT